MSVRHPVRHTCVMRASGGRGLPLIPPGVRHACTPVRACGGVPLVDGGTKND
jgi:hypothetical protein